MDFKEATDRLAGCYSLAEIAQAARVSEQTLKQARLDRANRNYRSPPKNWREVVVRLARERGGELSELADELELEDN